MGCSQTNVLEEKKLNEPKSNDQEAKSKNLDENKTTNVEASQAKEKKNVEPLNNEDKKIKEDRAISINKSKQFVKEEKNNLEEIKKDDENIIKAPPINKEEIEKDDANIKKEKENGNKAIEGIKKDDENIIKSLSINKDEIKKDDEKNSKEKENKKEETEKLKENKKNIETNPKNLDIKKQMKTIKRKKWKIIRILQVQQKKKI